MNVLSKKLSCNVLKMKELPKKNRRPRMPEAKFKNNWPEFKLNKQNKIGKELSREPRKPESKPNGCKKSRKDAKRSKKNARKRRDRPKKKREKRKRKLLRNRELPELRDQETRLPLEDVQQLQRKRLPPRKPVQSMPLQRR